MVKHWIPLESNPEVLCDYAAKLGCTAVPGTFAFCDIFSLDDDLLVMAVILLFPITPETELRKEGELWGVRERLTR